MAEGDLEHLKWQRLAPQNDRRRGSGFGTPRPADPAAHAGTLLGGLQKALVARATEIPGFDERALLKLEFHGATPYELRALPGVEVVSEEPGRIVLLFVDATGRDEFENRLRLVQQGQQATRQDLLFATKGIDAWTPDDRTSPALRAWLAEARTWRDGKARLDVELWPLSLDQPGTAERMMRDFRRAAANAGLEVLDYTSRAVVLLRVELTPEGLDWVLRHRDVRVVDLPPRFRLEPGLRRMPLSQLEVLEASRSAPLVGVLDSGVTINHPLLQPAAGATESFVAGLGPEDEHGHGTLVAGLAVYGDLELLVSAKTLRPTARLASGRVLDAGNDFDDKLIENQITQAVETLHRDYGCRVFNLSIGDERHPYTTGRLRPLAVTLDVLAQMHDVVFVVSAGNFAGSANAPRDWRSEYPDYLLSADAGILDPAPALNVLTVGGLARHEVSHAGIRNPNDPAYPPIAKRGQPSPFTRCGSELGPIKPELVMHAGNWGVDTRASNGGPTDAGLGVLSTQSKFVGGNLFDVVCGTSFAAPVVANLAARVLERYPQASSAFVRALLVVHAEVPEATRALVPSEDDRLRLVGYGEPDPRRVLASSEQAVTLYAEDELEENGTHFYEVPLPEDFTSGPARRRRRIRVAVAHTPIVRGRRADYRASRFEFRLVRAASVADVVTAYEHGSVNENRPEYAGASLGPARRKRGTVQAATWDFAQINRDAATKTFVLVVTRIVPDWALTLATREKYATVVAIEERDRVDVRYHAQVKAKLQLQARVRARTRG